MKPCSMCGVVHPKGENPGPVKTGYRVAIKVERFTYHKNVGSNTRVIVEPNVASPNGDWGLGDYDTLEKADAAVVAMTRSIP